MSKDTWCTYAHINRINQKGYIGKAKGNPENRWKKNGKGYEGQGIIGRAIKKYGWDNFDHIILESGLSEDEAYEREAALIIEHNTFYRDGHGYNLTRGGRGCPGLKHSEETMIKIMEMKHNGLDTTPIYQIDIHTNEIIKRWESVNQAARETKIHNASIREALRSKVRISHGYKWIRICDYNEDTLNYKTVISGRVSACQIDPIIDVVIRIWDKQADAAKAYGVRDSDIRRAKSSFGTLVAGYRWSSVDDVEINLRDSNDSGNIKSFYQICKKTGAILNTWDCLRAAYFQTGIHFSHIKKALDNKSISCAGGFRWIYVDEYEKLQKVKCVGDPLFERPVFQLFEKSGTTVKRWDSIYAAANKFNIKPQSIVNNIDGKTKLCSGYRWSFEAEWDGTDRSSWFGSEIWTDDRKQYFSTLIKKINSDPNKSEERKIIGKTSHEKYREKFLKASNVKSLYQFDISSGELINTYDSIERAVKSTNISRYAIKGMLEGNINPYYSFIFSYGEMFFLDDVQKETITSNRIFQICAQTGTIVSDWPSAEIASQKTGYKLASIKSAIISVSHYACKYYWVKALEYDSFVFVSKAKKAKEREILNNTRTAIPIYKIHPTEDIVLHKYTSKNNAAASNNINLWDIDTAVNGKHKIAGGFRWIRCSEWEAEHPDAKYFSADGMVS